ncbi:histidine phosphatase family protein [Shewanella sp. FJAT-52076]|uniref:histidine phosphatase family protein n=1 Tax=Shewanella sp. FJAT-52076 TaxID=2864202 RepID=UPI001C6615E3|nr:histidine phosphatase family protein [Shewanella sp. FJAT-52076]QYJ76131.1 histidine phosphatase family protein [Shewanella sp. FJAT-52076]
MHRQDADAVVAVEKDNAKAHGDSLDDKSHVQMSPLDIIFWRHGQCEDGAVLRGRSDAQPSEGALIAIAGKARDMAVPARIISSPLQRCARLAQALQAEITAAHPGSNPPDILFEPLLTEMDFGVWDGQSIALLWQTAPMEAWWQDPWAITPEGGEPMHAFEARVAEALQGLLAQAPLNDAGPLWVVTHGGVIRCLMAAILGAGRAAGFYGALELDYGARVHTRWYRTNGGWQGRLLWGS